MLFYLFNIYTQNVDKTLETVCNDLHFNISFSCILLVFLTLKYSKNVKIKGYELTW